MMTEPTKKDLEKKINDAYNSAKGFFDKFDYISALKKTENAISVHGKNELCAPHHYLQGKIFFTLAKETDDKDIKCVYLFASVDCHSSAIRLDPTALWAYNGCVSSLIELGDQLGENRFYEKAKSRATRGLLELELSDKDKTQLEELKNSAIEKMNSNEAGTISLVTQVESGKKEEEEKKRDPNVERLKTFWKTLDDEYKKKFLVVNLAEFKIHLESKYGGTVRGHYRKCVFAENHRWRYWRCHICAEVNYCSLDSRKHILDKHVHGYVTRFKYPKKVDKVLTSMIVSGNWKPVDTVAAEKLIKDRADREEESVYVNGWCSAWPVAKDKERESKLKQFAEVLKSYVLEPNDTLSCTLWEWLMSYTEENVVLHNVPGSYLDKCNFFKSPQCICFLGLNQLKHILKYVRPLTTYIRTSSVSKVVNRFWKESLVKERIDLVDGEALLLDVNLLCEGKDLSGETGELKICDSSAIYDNVIPNGDKIVSWVLGCPEIDEKLASQVAEGVYNVEIWFAVLILVRCTSRKMVKYHARKQGMLTYDEMLSEAEAICEKEDKRKNANQRSKYAVMLRKKCEEILKQDGNSKFFLRVVRDVLENVETPSVEAVEDGKSMEHISKLSNTVQDNDVKANLSRLKQKIHLVKFTNAELDFLPKLSAVDSRMVVLQFMKIFLREKLEDKMRSMEGPSAKRQRS